MPIGGERTASFAFVARRGRKRLDADRAPTDETYPLMLVAWFSRAGSVAWFFPWIRHEEAGSG